ncbi:LOW QUALITY PROTEIN: Ankyrin-1 [Drechslerella dactyloides]|uniref:Ankyrin-1 n=1 Tax=Drechslerella dactyloides TaxID=74499 RepID=A0AAD6NLH3_DREDA|nr:LOW QUALITY PROTEIN: Ankyrin-1 [Drechslerella dactyloides]
MAESKSRFANSLEVISGQNIGNPSLDIVAVHGFGGHNRQSWTTNVAGDQKECMWLKDLLPKRRLSMVRVMEFTYASMATGHSSVLSSSELTEIAQLLLESLLLKRKSTPRGNGRLRMAQSRSTPIVFIGHDLGGIIVKKVFFGTPHRALSTSSWEDLIFNVLSSYPQSMAGNLNMATRVKSFSRAVERLSGDFLSLPIRRCIINVYQEPGGPNDDNTVIERYSATTGLAHEINIGRPLRHGDICKFSDDGPELSLMLKEFTAGIVVLPIINFPRTRTGQVVLRKRAIETESTYAECLSALFNISPSLAVLEDEQDICMQSQAGLQAEYENWRQSSSSGIITTRSLRGVGESLNARSLFRELKKSCPSTSYFAFSESDVRKTHAVSFLSSIVFQVLSQDPTKFQRIESLYTDMKSSKAWTQAGFLVLFRSLLDQESKGPLYLVIDGLHKCDHSRQELLDALLVIFSNEHMPTKVKIAIFSQERQDLEEAFAKFGKLRMDGPTTSNTSLKLLASALAENVAAGVPDLSPLRPQISEALGRCTSSTELYIALHSLRNMDVTPRSLVTLREQIDMLPLQVKESVAAWCNSLGAWPQAALGWIMCAKRPLRLKELATAVALTDSDGKFDAHLDLEKMPLDMAAELRSVFGPLLRIENGKVLFSTDTIKECVHGVVVADAQASSEKEAKLAVIPDDARITRILLEYLSSEEFTAQIDKALELAEYIQPEGPQFDLTNYAVQFWPAHYRAVQKHDSQTETVLDFLEGGNKMLVLSKLFSKLSIAVPPPDVSVSDPLTFAAQLGLASIVEAREKELEGANRELAISLASWSGYADVVEILLRDAEKTRSCDLLRALKYASARGYDDIVEQLLEPLKSAKDLPSAPFDELICQSTRLGYERQVSLFLDSGARVEACSDGKTPLQHAAQNGHVSIVRFLLEKAGADVNSKASESRSPPILLATEGGYQTVVEHLLAFDAHIASLPLDTEQSTALHLAAEKGHEGIARLLVDHAAKAGFEPPSSKQEATAKASSSILDVKDVLGRSPLILACYEQHVAVAMLLLKRGANVTLADNEDHTALYYATLPGCEPLCEALIERAHAVTDFKDIGAIFLGAAKYGFVNVVRLCLVSEALLGENDVSLRNLVGELGKTALHYAAEFGHRDIVSLLLEAKALADEVDNMGRTPLTRAAVAGEIDIVKALLAAGANPLRKDTGNQTIVAQIAYDSKCTSVHADIVEILLDAGVDPNAISDGRRTALHWAVLGEASDVAECLLRYKANPDIKSSSQWNALHFAARNISASSLKVARILIDAGMDPLEEDEDGWIALHIASRWGNVAMLEMLWTVAPGSLDRVATDGRNVIHFGYDEPGSIKWAAEHKVDVNSLTATQETALMMAGSHPRPDCVKVLLDNLADATLRDGRLMTALHYAACGGSPEAGQHLLKADPSILSWVDESNLTAMHLAIRKGKPQFALMLLEEYYTKADVSVLNLAAREDGETPLISAVRGEQELVVERLLELGVDASARSARGDTALITAVARSSKPMMRRLLNPNIACPVDVNAGDKQHGTALYRAAANGLLGVVQELITLGADVNVEGGEFNTALCAAAAGDFGDVVKFLLKKGADARKPGGRFANAISASLNSTAFFLVPEMLVEAGADVNAADAQGRTALHIAASRATSMVEVLREFGADFTAQDKQGRTVFHHAAIGCDADLIFNLLEDDNLSDLNVADAHGWTPLHWAARQDGSQEVAEILIEHGADVTATTPDGWTPENIAVFHDATDMAEMMVEAARKRAQPPAAGDRSGEGDQPSDSATEDEEQAPESKAWRTGFRHRPSIACDGCFQSPIFGARWRCIDSPNFDYCFKCYWSAKDTHPGQNWERLPEDCRDDDRKPGGACDLLIEASNGIGVDTFEALHDCLTSLHFWPYAFQLDDLLDYIAFFLLEKKQSPQQVCLDPDGRESITQLGDLLGDVSATPRAQVLWRLRLGSRLRGGCSRRDRCWYDWDGFLCRLWVRDECSGRLVRGIYKRGRLGRGLRIPIHPIPYGDETLVRLQVLVLQIAQVLDRAGPALRGVEHDVLPLDVPTGQGAAEAIQLVLEVGVSVGLAGYVDLRAEPLAQRVSLHLVAPEQHDGLHEAGDGAAGGLVLVQAPEHRVTPLPAVEGEAVAQRARHALDSRLVGDHVGLGELPGVPDAGLGGAVRDLEAGVDRVADLSLRLRFGYRPRFGRRDGLHVAGREGDGDLGLLDAPKVAAGHEGELEDGQGGGLVFEHEPVHDLRQVALHDERVAPNVDVDEALAISAVSDVGVSDLELGLGADVVGVPLGLQDDVEFPVDCRRRRRHDGDRDESLSTGAGRMTIPAGLPNNWAAGHKRSLMV